MSRTVVFRILMAVYVAAVAFLCFGNFGSLPEAPGQLLGMPADKVAHFLMFLPFTVILTFCFSNPGKTPVRAVLGVAGMFLAGCAVAAATELVQGTLPYRTADAKDFLADALALAAGSVATIIITACRHRRAAANDEQ